jgi:hypothetical protein
MLKIIKTHKAKQERKIASRMSMSHFFCEKENLNVEERRNRRTRSGKTSAEEEEG